MDEQIFSFDWKGFGYAITTIGVGILVLRGAVSYGVPHAIALVSSWREHVHSGTLVAAASDSVASTSIATSSEPISYDPTTPWRIMRTVSIDTVVPAAGDLIAINVPNMMVETYHNGQRLNTYPIVSIASSSFSTVPQGMYSIMSADKKDTTRTATGYISFSIGLSGSCSIHGDPRDASMHIIDSTTAVGCVRLSESDAADVFHFAASTTPVFVYRPTASGADQHITIGHPSVPTVTADAYLVGDIDNGTIYTAHNATTTYPIASLTKLMTTLVLAQRASSVAQVRIDPSLLFKEEVIHSRTSTTTVTISDPVASAQAYVQALDAVLPVDASSTEMVSTSTLLQLASIASAGATSTKTVVHVSAPPRHIRSSDIFTVNDLTTAMVLQSNNDIAQALAQYVGLDTVIPAMNTIAGIAGMTSTTYVDASGLSSDDTSTVTDLFSLAQYIAQAFPSILDLTHRTGATITAVSHTSYQIHNVNHPADQDGFIGGKVGETSAAKETSIMIAQVTINGVPHRIAIIVLHSSDQSSDVDALLGWFKQAAQAS